MIRAGGALLLAATLLAPEAVSAQGRWERQVRDQLKRAGRVLEDRGFELTHDVYTGSLRDDESESLTLTLRGGNDYALVGVCDEDCRDIDLRLYDLDGEEVDIDIEDDDTPIVQVSASSTGKYRLRVIMASCSTSPCFYGVGTFGK